MIVSEMCTASTGIRAYCPGPFETHEVAEEEGGAYAKSIVMLSSAGAATSRTVFILVAIFLGYFGIHNFIAGYKGKGIAQLLITVLSFFIFSIFVWIWAVVEAIVVKEDANGQEMV